MFSATSRRLKNLFRFRYLCILLLTATGYGAGVPDDCTQLIVGIAPDWNSKRGHLQRFERVRGGNWTPVAAPIPVLLGKHGVAWGSGLAGQSESGLRKA